MRDEVLTLLTPELGDAAQEVLSRLDALLRQYREGTLDDRGRALLRLLTPYAAARDRLRQLAGSSTDHLKRAPAPEQADPLAPLSPPHAGGAPPSPPSAGEHDDGPVPVLAPPVAGPADVGHRSDAHEHELDADPPRSAFALLECPDRVVVAEEFELEVGLSSVQQADVVGDALLRPPSSVGPYVLAVRLMVDQFSVREGEELRFLLMVTAQEPHPRRRLHLTPLPLAGSEPEGGRMLQATFSVAGQVLGVAGRSVVVDATGTVPPVAAPSAAVVGRDVAVTTDGATPDLTLTITRGDDVAGGSLVWAWESPHLSVPAPSGEDRSRVGQQPQAFQKDVMRKVAARDGKPNLESYLRGVGAFIGAPEVFPPGAWKAVRAAGQAVGGPPAVLLLSQEPYVPWELAWMPEPLQPDAPAFLGAQTVLSRWSVSVEPAFVPPPRDLRVSSMAVVSGDYSPSGHTRLEAAEQEAVDLQDDWAAVAVNATTSEVLRVLAGTPPADVLHFALHGRHDPTGAEDGLVLVDAERLDPKDVLGHRLSRAPLVFLNACQVGASAEVLGDTAGMAVAFLKAGACAVVAPLWSVNDVVARDVARRFYTAVFEDSQGPAEFFRRERASFGAAPDGAAPSGACVAYAFFGHPMLEVSAAPTRRGASR